MSISPERCCVCGKLHNIRDGSWVILASSHFVCALSDCIKGVNEIEKEGLTMNRRNNYNPRNPAAKHSEQSAHSASANPQINSIIQNIAKHSNSKYREAIQRSKQSPLDELQRRVMKKLRPSYSADRFSELQNHISGLPPFQRQVFLSELELEAEKIRR